MNCSEITRAQLRSCSFQMGIAAGAPLLIGAVGSTFSAIILAGNMAVYYASAKLSAAYQLSEFKFNILSGCGIALYNLALAVTASTLGAFSFGTALGTVASIGLFAVPFFLVARHAAKDFKVLEEHITPKRCTDFHGFETFYANFKRMICPPSAAQ